MLSRREFIKYSALVSAGSLFLPKLEAKAFNPKRVFYISDQGIDPDDALDAWKLAVHARRRDIQIVGAASCVNSGYAAPVLKLIFEQFGLNDIPYGKYVGNDVLGFAQVDCWGHGLATNFGGLAESNGVFAQSVTLLNDTLANSPDNSVYILSTGPLTVEADSLALSGGPALWAAKVAAHYIVSGDFGAAGLADFGAGWNMNVAVNSARAFIFTRPNTIPIVWCGGELVPSGTTDTIWAGPPDTPDDTVSYLKWIWHNACNNHIGQTTDPLPDNDGAGNGGMRWMWSAPAIEDLINPGRVTGRTDPGYVTFTEAQATYHTVGSNPVSGRHNDYCLTSLITSTQWKALLAADMANVPPFGSLNPPLEGTPQALVMPAGGNFKVKPGNRLRIGNVE